MCIKCEDVDVGVEKAERTVTGARRQPQRWLTFDPFLAIECVDKVSVDLDAALAWKGPG